MIAPLDPLYPRHGNGDPPIVEPIQVCSRCKTDVSTGPFSVWATPGGILLLCGNCDQLAGWRTRT